MKIKVIKQKVKEVNPDGETDKNNGLEDEVYSDELPSESSGAANITPLIRGSGAVQERPQEIESAVTTRTSDEQVLFSQGRIYSTVQGQASQRTSYVTPEQAIRRFNPSIAESSREFDPQGRRETFVSQELERMRSGIDDKDYNKPLDLNQEEKKRKLPWEI